jgi:hypothetical protein
MHNRCILGEPKQDLLFFFFSGTLIQQLIDCEGGDLDGWTKQQAKQARQGNVAAAKYCAWIGKTAHGN